jgi:thiamine-phosphate pyrophosphorylase
MSPRERIAGAQLYLVCDARPREFLAAAIRGGVDVIQLRDKALGDEDLVTAAREFRAAADAHGALFVLNDRPDLVEACGADGVHVGQDDGEPAAARAAVGPERIVGRSTHAPEQADAAEADPAVDYLAVGPVHATPTKPGRPAAGLDYVAYAAAHARKPWFAIGGLDAGNVSEVVARGATRVVVVRAIAGADDPETAARALRAALEDRGQAQP